MPPRRPNLEHEPLQQPPTWFPLPEKGACSFSIRHLRTRAFPFPFHYHRELELTWIVAGRGRRVLGEVVESFGAGDLVLVGAMLPHVWLSDRTVPGTEAFVLRFQREELERGALGLSESRPVREWLAGAGRGLAWRAPLPASWEAGFRALERERDRSLRLVRFLELLTRLSAGEAWVPICPRLPRAVIHGGVEQRIGYALRFLRENPCEPIRQAELARRLGMEPSAFSRLFRRITGKTFQTMRIELRLEQACRLLRATDWPVAEVCFAAGFGNLANFNRQFLRTEGRTPRAYRRAVIRGEER